MQYSNKNVIFFYGYRTYYIGVKKYYTLLTCGSPVKLAPIFYTPTPYKKVAPNEVGDSSLRDECTPLSIGQ